MNLLRPELQGELALPRDREVESISSLVKRVAERHGNGPGFVHVTGAEGSGGALLAHGLSSLTGMKLVYVTANAALARKALSDLNFFDKERNFLPHGAKQQSHSAAHLALLTSESGVYDEVLPEGKASSERLSTLFHLALGRPWQTVVTSAEALLRRVVPRHVMRGAGRVLAVADNIDVSELVGTLVNAGYLRVPVVEDPATLAVRGSLLDIWPAQLPKPVRIELLGDEIVSLRSFDPDTQRTSLSLTELVLPPARDALLDPGSVDVAKERLRELCDSVNLPSSKARALVEDLTSGRLTLGADAFLPAFYELAPVSTYFGDALWLFEDPPAVLAALKREWENTLQHEPALTQPHFAPETLLVEPTQLESAYDKGLTLCLHRAAITGSEQATGLARLELAPEASPSLALSDQSALERAGRHERESRGKAATLDPFLSRLAAWRDAGLKTTISARTEAQAARLTSLLSHAGFSLSEELRIITGSLERGLVAQLDGFVLVTEEEIFGHRVHSSPARRRSGKNVLEDLRALTIGDLVVHAEHGVGRYLGLERKLLPTGASVELLILEYAGGDRLFLPVYRLNQVQKFSGGEAVPKLDRLGGISFAKTKARVRRKVREMADELLRLYAERARLEKTPLPPPDDEYAAFEAAFPYEETGDQAAAIQDVLLDLQMPKLMDRLVCGDVGFGKTEVALRATFRNAMAGRQVALLCPTTVLAEQHYQTLLQRFAHYPITIRALSRFQSKNEQSKTITDLRAGKVDVVVGTHRLLSHDVHFKNLGLLIVDEEQRFGVVHKERIKQLCTAVDVLTLTATPIPRTLQLGLGGLRDMSVIATPPADRRAIRTVISKFDPAIIEGAISRELSRGGQVFYVYNRIEDIYQRANFLQELVPKARIAVGHGQMSATALENTMMGFVRGEFDVLVSTAIIESGLDIPRANTMLIDRADNFGLAQLYQLRGRVGRSRERAYCYLLVPAPSELSDEARSRIEAMERYSDLSSGFHVASLDMEIRGAGNLLGAEQSGTVSHIGFDLFCQMLAEATQELQGIAVVHEVDPELSFDVEALLPDDYVPEVGTRLSLYKRFASALDESDVMALASEMEDRFGRPPTVAVHLVELMRLKTELRRLRVLACEATQKSITLHLREDTPLDAAKITKLLSAKRTLYRITPDMKLLRRLGEGETATSSLAFADKVLAELSSL